MFILVHVLIAISSLVYTAHTYITPTKNKLRNSYILIGSTLLSGTYLIFANQVNILRTCVSGLTFLAVTTIITRQARLKYELRHQSVSTNTTNK